MLECNCTCSRLFALCERALIVDDCERGVPLVVRAVCSPEPSEPSESPSADADTCALPVLAPSDQPRRAWPLGCIHSAMRSGNADALILAAMSQKWRSAAQRANPMEACVRAEQSR